MPVLELAGQTFRKIRNPTNPQAYKLHTDHDMAQKLAVVGVIVGRKGGKFLGFSNVMKHGRRNEEVSVQEIILVRIEIAEFYHA